MNSNNSENDRITQNSADMHACNSGSGMTQWFNSLVRGENESAYSQCIDRVATFKDKYTQGDSQQIAKIEDVLALRSELLEDRIKVFSGSVMSGGLDNMIPYSDTPSSLGFGLQTMFGSDHMSVLDKMDAYQNVKRVALDRKIYTTYAARMQVLALSETSLGVCRTDWVRSRRIVEGLAAMQEGTGLQTYASIFGRNENDFYSSWMNTATALDTLQDNTSDIWTKLWLYTEQHSAARTTTMSTVLDMQVASLYETKTTLNDSLLVDDVKYPFSERSNVTANVGMNIKVCSLGWILAKDKTAVMANGVMDNYARYGDASDTTLVPILGRSRNVPIHYLLSHLQYPYYTLSGNTTTDNQGVGFTRKSIPIASTVVMEQVGSRVLFVDVMDMNVSIGSGRLLLGGLSVDTGIYTAADVNYTGIAMNVSLTTGDLLSSLQYTWEAYQSYADLVEGMSKASFYTSRYYCSGTRVTGTGDSGKYDRTSVGNEYSDSYASATLIDGTVVNRYQWGTGTTGNTNALANLALVPQGVINKCSNLFKVYAAAGFLESEGTQNGFGALRGNIAQVGSLSAISRVFTAVGRINSVLSTASAILADLMGVNNSMKRMYGGSQVLYDSLRAEVLQHTLLIDYNQKQGMEPGDILQETTVVSVENFQLTQWTNIWMNDPSFLGSWWCREFSRETLYDLSIKNGCDTSIASNGEFVLVLRDDVRDRGSASLMLKSCPWRINWLTNVIATISGMGGDIFVDGKPLSINAVIRLGQGNVQKITRSKMYSMAKLLPINVNTLSWWDYQKNGSSQYVPICFDVTEGTYLPEVIVEPDDRLTMTLASRLPDQPVIVTVGNESLRLPVNFSSNSSLTANRAMILKALNKNKN